MLVVVEAGVVVGVLAPLPDGDAAVVGAVAAGGLAGGAATATVVPTSTTTVPSVTLGSPCIITAPDNARITTRA
jgi:hypothetical protein